MAKAISEFTLSPTKVDTFQKCPRQFYYNYIKQPFPQTEKKWFLIGNVVHKALQDFHGPDFINGRWPKLMSKCFKDAIKSHNALAKVKSGLITTSDLYSMKNMLRDYLHYLRSGVAVNIFSLEKLAKIDVKGVPVWLKSDRVDRLPQGGYLVIDYKTSKTPAPKKEELSSVQLPSYGMWIRQKFDKKARVDGAYFYIRHIRNNSGVHSHEVTDRWMEIASTKYVDVYSQIQNGCAYTPVKNARNCNWCDYRLPCSSNYGLK